MIEIYAQSYNGQPATADLRCVFGPDGGTFGRGSDNRLCLPDPARHVSREQGRVRWDGARYWIANTSDANPMFLNDEEIEARRERPLAAGDEIRVGLYVLRVREAADAGIEYRPTPAAPRPAPAAPPLAGPLPTATPASRVPIQAGLHRFARRRLDCRATTPSRTSSTERGRAACAIAARAHAESVALGPRARRRCLSATRSAPADLPLLRRGAGTSPVNTADPFGDLLGTPSAPRPAHPPRHPRRKAFRKG